MARFKNGLVVLRSVALILCQERSEAFVIEARDMCRVYFLNLFFYHYYYFIITIIIIIIIIDHYLFLLLLLFLFLFDDMQ